MITIKSMKKHIDGSRLPPKNVSEFVRTQGKKSKKNRKIAQ
jgi:hypothetical protein